MLEFLDPSISSKTEIMKFRKDWVKIFAYGILEWFGFKIVGRLKIVDLGGLTSYLAVCSWRRTMNNICIAWLLDLSFFSISDYHLCKRTFVNFLLVEEWKFSDDLSPSTSDDEALNQYISQCIFSPPFLIFNLCIKLAHFRFYFLSIFHLVRVCCL